MSENLNCSICGNIIGIDKNGWSQGNNAKPINDGRCCHLCDCMIVIPIRIMNVQLAEGHPEVHDVVTAAYKHYAGLGVSMLLERTVVKEKTL